MKKLAELIAKLEALEGPSREVDCEIAVALDGFITRPNKGYPDRLDYISIAEDGSETCPGHGFDQLVRRYTYSLDAAVALRERVIPGCDYIIANVNNGLTPYAQLNSHEKHFGATPIISLLIAIFRALEKGE